MERLVENDIYVWFLLIFFKLVFFCWGRVIWILYNYINIFLKGKSVLFFIIYSRRKGKLIYMVISSKDFYVI